MATKKSATKKTAVVERLIPPPNGATVRMYRIGHGDCFLLAFPGKSASEPTYVLIDCGYKPGSNKPEYIGTSAKEITAHIKACTGGRIDVAVITHEHQDHVNGITEKNFEGIEIGQTWLAWTEDPNDDLANRLRVKFKDQLIGLIDARNALAAGKEDTGKVDRFLEFELGDEVITGPVLAAAKKEGGGMNKASMKLFKDKAKSGVKYLRPHEKIWQLPNNKDVRVYPLGPPRDEGLIDSLDPVGKEEFHLGAAGGGTSAAAAGFLAAARASVDSSVRNDAPFGLDYRIPLGDAAADSEDGSFFLNHYGDDKPVAPVADLEECPSNADWRRIDKDWLFSSEALALAMNSKTNNASLVLAFELGKDGKVLLFAADAQRGNWISWGQKSFKEGSGQIEVKELLGRTVLYKVGHHGSHNATLDGSKTSDWANISWMASTSEAAREFTAMITAVRAWAETQDGWDHPLASIKARLMEKSGGRVFQTDTDIEKMESRDGREKEWKDFQKRASGHRLYFDYRIEG